MFDPTRVKFNEYVWHDQPYHHPQLHVEVERDFYNREKEKQRSRALLRSLTSRQPVIFIGERRAGKTSMLRLIANDLKNDPSGRFVPVLIPWQGINSRAVLFQEILQGICFELDVELPGIGSPPVSLTQGEPTISQLINTLRGPLQKVAGKTIVLCIDEFDSIIYEEVRSSAEASKIVGLASGLVENSDLSIKPLLTMARSPSSLESTHSSPLTAKAEQIRLDHFAREDMDEMITDLVGAEVDLSDAQLERLYELSGGWPYFAKLLLVCMAGLEPGDDWLDRALKQALKHSAAKQTLEHIYNNHFSDHEKAVVLLLGRKDGHLSSKEMACLDVNLRTAARRLVVRDFLKADGHGGYAFRIGFLQEWFPSWIRFEEQMEVRLKDVLRRLDHDDDPWAGSKPTIIEEEDLKKYDL